MIEIKNRITGEIILTIETLKGADLRYVDLRYADLTDVDLSDSDLSFADLRYADLRYADLNGAKTRTTNVTGAYLRGYDGMISDKY
jgi:uncharacterized protein YjbI with pentapeptide repeats